MTSFQDRSRDKVHDSSEISVLIGRTNQLNAANVRLFEDQIQT